MANSYIDDVRIAMNTLNDQHPQFMLITLVVFNLCALLAIPFMVIGLLALGIWKLISYPFRPFKSNESEDQNNEGQS